MWREEVSFLQADCWMERLRDGQMTMAWRPGPECRLRETYTLLHVGSSHYTLSAQSRGLHSGFGKVIPSPTPPQSISCQPLPFSLLPSPTSPLSPLPPFVDTQPGGDELTQRVKTSLGALSTPLPPFCLFFRGDQIMYAVSLGSSSTEKLLFYVYVYVFLMYHVCIIVRLILDF